MKADEMLEQVYPCPDDRELALRATIGSGWSTHRTPNPKTKFPPLTQAEKQKIDLLLSKHEDMTRLEQERIGMLVEKLKNMKHNTLGDGVETCLVCGVKTGLLTERKRVCIRCHHVICSKCSVECYVSQDSSWYCIICSEEREFWKKSGAWRLKAVPFYILPSNTDGRYSKSENFTHSMSNMSLSGSDEYSDSDVEETVQTHRIRSTDHRLNTIVSVSSSTGNNIKPSKDCLNSTSSTTRITRSSSSDQSEDSRSSDAGHSSTSLLSDSSRTVPRAPTKPTVPWTDFTSDSIGPDSGSSLGTGTLHKEVPAMQEKSPGILAQSWNSMLSIHSNASSVVPGSPGSIQFLVDYNSSTLDLFLTITSCKELTRSKTKQINPYVKCFLHPDSSKASKMKTSVMQNNPNPCFHENLQYWGVSKMDLAKKKLVLMVMDACKLKHNALVGCTQLDLQSLLTNPNQQLDLELSREALSLEDHTDDTPATAGKIHVGITFKDKQKVLEVTIARAANLSQLRSKQPPNPYVKCYLINTKSDSVKKDDKSLKKKTSTKKRTNNPEFNEVFHYQVSDDVMSRCSLEISAWSHELPRNRPIGGLYIGFDQTGDTLRHWFDVFKNPNQHELRWHDLRSDFATSDS